MRLTATQLRQIIREEAAHALSGSSVNPAEIEAMDEYEVLKVVAEIGERVQGAGNRGAGMVYSYRGIGNPALADKLDAAVARLDEECRALQVCVAALKRKSSNVRARKNLAALKAGKPESGEM